jgi:hypothetical protein
LNPITETRYNPVRYVVLWGLFAASYAAAFGIAAALPAGAAALDGAVFGVVSGIEVLILWNVLKYGAVGSPTERAGAWNSIRIGRFVQVAVAGILFVSVAVGAECLALYPATGTLPAKFAMTIPARCLITAAVYACFVLWYSSAARSDYNGAVRPTTGADTVEPTRTTSAAPAADYPERITVRGSGGNIEVIGVDEIVYIQAEGDYVAIVTAAGRRLKEGTMKSFEEMLPATKFVRVHRSYIVAVSHISRIETSGRDHLLVLRDGGPNSKSAGSIRISDAGYKLLKRTLGL